MVDIDALYQAIGIVFTLKTLIWLFIGVTVGVGVGAMPGLQGSTAIALMLPFSFTMELGPAIGILIGVYKGATFGGAISAITFSTPGAPDNAATVIDGYKLMKAGKGRKALLMALYASVTADFLSDVLTILVAPLLALVALKFGPSERFWLMALAITLIGGLSGNHLSKGLFSAAFGLFIGTIGTDPIGLVSRNTFGIWWLSDGIDLVPMLIGLFAISMVFEEVMKSNAVGIAIEKGKNFKESILGKSEGLTFREYLGCWKEMGIGLGIGSFVGMLPGLGGTAGAFLSYAVARNASPKKNIGSGRLEGVAAAEAGNNATVGPTLIPLLAFGIPGSTNAALIGGALTLQGATPSPRMFELFPEVVYSLFLILLIGNIFNLGIGRIFSSFYAKLGEVPKQYLVPGIAVMATVGTYSYQNNPYQVVYMMIFGVVGLLFKTTDIPVAPMIITFLLAPMAEENLRRACMIGGDNWVVSILSSPISIGLMICTVGFVFFSIFFGVRKRLDSVKDNVISDVVEPKNV